MTSGATLTGAQAAVHALEHHDVEVIFGIPGTHTLPLYRHLATSSIRHVTPRHEQGGGYAADGYARSSGRPGVCVVTTGPGALNAITPAATAYADSIPQLIISTGMPCAVEGTDSGYLHETKNQHAALDAVTAWSRRLDAASEIPAAIHEAFELFETSRPRPVHIEIPLDLLDRDAETADPPARDHSGTGPTPDEGLIEQAAELLLGAASPALILGGGAREASREATELAERLGAPVITTVNGKAVISELHPLSLGASLRLEAARRWLQDRDALLVVGSELGESDLWGPPLVVRGRVVRVDLDASQLQKNLLADIALHGRAKPTLQALLEGLHEPPGRPCEAPSGLRAELDDEAREEGTPWIELSAAVEHAAGDGGVICADSTMASYFGVVHFTKLAGPSRLMYPTGYATLGYAVPAAIGAKLAAPQRSVIVIVGDGGLMFTLAEILTASELRLGLPVVVVNNGGYGEIKRQMQLEAIPPIAVDLRNPDFMMLANALGAAGCRPTSTDELRLALNDAPGRDRPTLIEIQEEPRCSQSR